MDKTTVAVDIGKRAIGQAMNAYDKILQDLVEYKELKNIIKNFKAVTACLVVQQGIAYNAEPLGASQEEEK